MWPQRTHTLRPKRRKRGVETVKKGVARVGEVGRRSAAKFAFMAACFHFLSTSQVKQELSGDFLPKPFVMMRRHLIIATQTLSLFVSFEYDHLSEE